MIGFVNAPREKLFENEHLFFWFSDGILFAEYKPVVIDAEVVSQAIAARVKFCNGKNYPALVDGRKARYWTRESRILSFKHPDAVTKISAFALLVDNQVGMVLVNWVTRFLDTKVPLKAFTDQQKALQWLEQFKS